MRTIRKVLALMALSALSLTTSHTSVQAATAVKPQPLPIQTVTFNTWELPAFAELTSTGSGLLLDIWMANGACTQNPTKQAGVVRLTFQMSSQMTAPYEIPLNAYGKYCVWTNAWTTDGITFLPATILTTVNVVQVAPPNPSSQPNTTTQAMQTHTVTSVHNQ